VSEDIPPEWPESATGTSPGGLRSVLRRIRAIPTPLVFGIAVSIALVVLWRQGAINDVRIAVRKADRTTVIVGLALYPAALALLCLRWHLLVRMVKGESHGPRASEAFLTSVVLNYTAPISVASASRAALTKRALGLSVAETSAVALTEVVLDLTVLGIGSVAWLAYSGHAQAIVDALPTTALVAAGMLIVLVIAGGTVAAAFARRRSHIWERVRNAAETVLVSPRRRPREALLALLVSVAYWTAQGIVLWTLLRAFSGESNPTLALGVITVPVLLGMLSGLPGGAGVREALMVAVARAHSADSAEVLVAAVTYRLALFAAIPILYAAVRVWLMFDSGPPAPRGTMANAASGDHD
jgi:uncharacterized protein (TIRG00374 family)